MCSIQVIGPRTAAVVVMGNMYSRPLPVVSPNLKPRLLRDVILSLQIASNICIVSSCEMAHF